MKTRGLLRCFTMLLLLCLVLGLCACRGTKDYSEKIIGDWQRSSSDRQGYFPGYICFSENGVCEDYDFDEQPTWRITEDSLDFIFEDCLLRYRIVSLTDETLQLSFTQDGITETAKYIRDR
ncbi:MAG: hypothetical protein ACI3VX_06750 [Faecousia sp.]